MKDNARLIGTSFDSFKSDMPPLKYPAAHVITVTESESSKRKRLVDEGDIDSFDWQCWKIYFVRKAEAAGMRMFDNKRAYIESSIIKGCMKKFSPEEFKTIIDFLWDSDHNLTPKERISLNTLSSGWHTVLYNSAMAWKNKETSGSKTNSKREWREPKKDSNKKTPRIQF